MSFVNSCEVTNYKIQEEILKKKDYIDDIFNQKKKNIYSQSGEDGIIEYIFSKIGTTNKYCVEFGACNGVHLSNTANLKINNGWNRCLFECDPSKIPENSKEINLHNEFIKNYNINNIFQKYFIPYNFDLLSIDIDSHDYYVWESLNYKPRIVIVEYNAGISNHIPVTIAESLNSIISPNANYFGANLHAFYNLGKKKGYEFITCTNLNAFFIINEDFDKLGIKTISKEECLKNYVIKDDFYSCSFNYDLPWKVVN